MDNKILSLKKINFSYSKEKILKDISFDVLKGDYLGIIGPNGSGKTTLLKIILGLLNPESGNIKLFGKDISKFREWSKIGYISQKATSFDNNFPLTVKETVSLGLVSSKKFPKFFRKEDEEKIRFALRKTGMEEYYHKKITELSGGQQQRVFISRALVTNPELLVLDEPTTGVDKNSQENFYTLLGELNLKDKFTIIIVSHDISYITRYVTKVACLNQTLLFHGTHSDFCSSGMIDKVLGHEKHIVCHDNHRRT